MNSFDYVRPTNIAEAIDLVSGTPASAFIAGGTNLIDLWKYNLVNPSRLVDLGGTDIDRAITENDDGTVKLGAFLTNSETAYHPVIEKRYPLLSRAILAGASAQIRNMATNGGNLLQRTRCYYYYDPAVPCNKRSPGSGCPAIPGHNRMHAILGASEHCIAVFPSDMCVALAALDAKVNVTGKHGERTILFEDFHRLPGDDASKDNTLEQGEVITGIELPSLGFANNYSYLKIRDRNSYAFALVSVAVGLELEGSVIKQCRIALGGVAQKPWRVKEAEEFLVEQDVNEKNLRQSAEIMLAGAKGYKYNSFKIELSKRAIVRAGMMAINPNQQLPGAQPTD